MRVSQSAFILSTVVVTLGAGAGFLASGHDQAAGAPSVATTPDARAARVERGLLPGTIIKGRSLPSSSLADRMAALKTPGVSVAVINDGAVEWARGYGVTETATTVAVTPRTLFQAASISKPVTALAALRLVEQGRLSLDEPVNSRLVSWRVPENDLTRTEKVTLRRLLNHSAGLTVHGFGGYEADTQVPTLVQVLDGQRPANSAAIRVDVVPGSLWRYSGGGYTVVQQLLTDVTGRPFPALLKELVLEPVGMRDSFYEQPLPAERRGQAASGHNPSGGVLPGRFHTYPELAAAGLWTTPTDLAKFLIAIQQAVKGTSSSPILSAGMARQMITVLSGHYGLGLAIDGAGPAASFGHGGANAGFRCQMTAYVESGRGAVVMTNGDQGGRLAPEILRAIAVEYDWPSYRPREKTVVTVDRAALARLTGRYALQGNRTVVVSLDGDTLFISEGQLRLELHAESPTRFFELVQNSDVEFVIGADGTPSHLMINGQLKAPRL